MNRSGWECPTTCAVIAATVLTVVITPSGVWADPVLVQSETKITPALTVTERYDSNVFFVQGGNLEDYVTAVAPQLRVDHSDRLVTGSLTGTVTGEAYVKNPGLNYIAPSGALTMNLDGLMGQLDKRARLTVSDSFAFTPKPLAFIGPSTGSEVPDTFVRGIQTQRANSRTNVANVTAGYQFTPVVSLQGMYTNSMFRYGTVFVPPPNTSTSQPAGSAFFSTHFQSYSVGPHFTLTPLDVVSVNYQGSRANYDLPSGATSSFQTQGGTLTWIHTFTPTFTANGTGGFSVIGGPNSTLTYVGDASLQWKHQHGGATLRYSRSIFPSFFIVAVPLLSQVITISGSYGLTGNLSATGSASYAKNESTSGQVPLSFESYSVSFLLTYTITRSVSAIASVTHYEFNQTFTGIETTFNRNVVSLSLRGEWN